MMEQAGVPSRTRYLVFGVPLLLCALGGPVVFVVYLITTLGSGHQFLAPGATTLDSDKSVKYALWYDNVTFFQGHAYTFPGDLPNGLRVRILEHGTDREVPMAKGFEVSASSGSDQRRSVGDFTLAGPGTYRIEVTGDFEQRVFSVRRSLIPGVLWALLALLLMELVGWSGAFICFRGFSRQRPTATKV
jgi:hypothetical protein